MKKENLKLDNLVKISIILGIVLISFSVFYYFVILPTKVQNEVNKIGEKYENELVEELENENKKLMLERRDSQRITDIKKMQTAVELYFNDASKYPDELITGSLLYYEGATYLNYVPNNPVPTENICLDYPEYVYKSTKAGYSYELFYCLEIGIAGISPGQHRATPVGTTDP